MEDNQKRIGGFAIKTKTQQGEFCKTICVVYSNGITHINQVILSEKESLPEYTKIYTKLGKSIFVKSIGFKYPTLNSLHKEVSRLLDENKTKVEDILF